MICNFIGEAKLDRRNTDLLMRDMGIPLNKPNADLRPISNIMAIIKITSAMFNSTESGIASSFCTDIQLGGNVKGGVEALPHIIRALLELNPTWTVIHRDSKNAFNEINRGAVLENIFMVNRNMFRYAWWTLTNERVVTYVNNDDEGDNLDISANSGLPQGSPTSSMWFNTTQAAQMLKALECFPVKDVASPDYFFLQVIDDGYLIGPLETILPIDEALVASLAEIDLVNDESDKNYAYSPTSYTNEEINMIQGARLHVIAHTEGFMAAGVPLGSDDYIHRRLSKTLEKISGQIEWIKEACADVAIRPSMTIQTAMMISRLCLASQFTYIMRTVPPKYTNQYAKIIDDKIFDLIMSMTQSCQYTQDNHYAKQARLRLFLPIKLGGFGFTNCLDTTDAAYVSSLCLVGPLIAKLCPQLATTVTVLPSLYELEQAINRLQPSELLKSVNSSTIWLESINKLQKGLKLERDVVNQKRLLSFMPQGMPLSGYEVGGSLTNIEVEIRASFLAQSKKETGAWISAMPRGLTSMANQTFIMAFHTRNIFPIFTNKFCKCGEKLDPLGGHFFICRNMPIRNQIRNSMHSLLLSKARDIIKACLPVGGSMCLTSEKEPHYEDFFARIQSLPEGISDEFCHDINKRGDIAITQTIVNAPNSTLVLDATYTHPASKSHGFKYNNPGSSAEFVSELKRVKAAKYFDIDGSATAELGILAFETTGVFSKESLKFCQFLTMDTRGSPTYSEKMMLIKQRFAVALASIRARMMLLEMRSLSSSIDPSPINESFYEFNNSN